MNISSALVSPVPGCGWVLRLALEELPGVEVHAVSPEGKLVITLEGGDDQASADAFETVQRLDGVLCAALIYTHTEMDPNEEIGDETDAT